MTDLLWTSNDWSFELIEKTWNVIDKISKDLNLSYYNPQIEIISSELMLDAYSSVALPIFYRHWSFGKQLVIEETKYRKGYSGLAMEVVINSDPLITYLMENNTMTTQALVLAHSISGHGHFFKNNYLFNYWTDPSGIIDYLLYAREYIEEQEVKYGRKVVEDWIDSCHALMEYGVNRYKRPNKLSMKEEKQRQQERADYLQKQINELYSIAPTKKTTTTSEDKWPKQPEENLLYFFEKYSPDLEIWQREILRIIRKIAQYFYPQSQTKMINEGFASFIHYKIMNILHERNMTSDGSHLEFLSLHTSVLYQPDYNSKHYSGFNPYALGFAILKDIERMCQNPTEEDLHWFPVIKNSNSHELILDAATNFRDESFIRQWLSPHLMRKWKLFKLRDDKSDNSFYHITDIHNDRGYDTIRTSLADQYERMVTVPRIEVVKVNKKTRTLYLEYTPIDNRKLDNVEKMLPHLQKLWGYEIDLRDKYGNNLIKIEDIDPLGYI